jgi:TonB-dependent SusC/RagA subfamily outer membrane receptor
MEIDKRFFQQYYRIPCRLFDGREFLISILIPYLHCNQISEKMKYLLMLAITISFVSTANAQDQVALLQGTWKLKNYKYDGVQYTSKSTRTIRYKSYTSTNFTVLEIDTATGVIVTSIIGNYKLVDSTYSETVSNVNKESAFMIGKTFSFKLSFKDSNTISTVGSFNGINSEEVWEKANAMKGVTIIDGINKLSKLQPLYVIQNKLEQIKFNSSIEEGKSPLALIPQNSIASIEVLKDATAFELYGAAGRQGVIIITIIESEQANVVKLLKAAGLID